MTRLSLPALLLLLTILAGCAGLLQKPEPPKLSLAGISLVEGNLFEQRFLIKLRVDNPNNTDLPLEGLRYQLDIDGVEFMQGQTGESVTLKRLESTVLEVDAYMKLFDLLRQLKTMGKTGKVTYRLRGEAFVGPGGWRLPFDRTGEYDLSALDRLKGLKFE